MGDIKHRLGLHTWRREVVSTEYVPEEQFNMWSRPVHGRSVVCHARYVCDACGATKDDGGCICSTEKGETCRVRLDCLEHDPSATR